LAVVSHTGPGYSDSKSIKIVQGAHMLRGLRLQGVLASIFRCSALAVQTYAARNGQAAKTMMLTLLCVFPSCVGKCPSLPVAGV